MKDKDTMALIESYEHIFSGVVDNDSDDDDKKDNDDGGDSSPSDSDKEESKDNEDTDNDDSPEEEDDDGDDDGDSDSDSDSDDSDSDSSDDDGESGDGDSDGGGDAAIASKVKTLQTQYNDLLKDAFEKYAPHCIEAALDGTESAFGADIEVILDAALHSLKSKILGDLGIEATPEYDMSMGGDPTMGPEGGVVMSLGGEAPEGAPVEDPGESAPDASEDEDEDEE